jgi:hypothetical protein
MTLRFTDVNQGPSLLFYSYDRGKNWEGAFEFRCWANGESRREPITW